MRFKCVLLGAVGSGKTSLAHRLAEDPACPSTVHRAGVDFYLRHVALQDETLNVTLQMWDIDAGAVSGALLRTCLSGAQAVLFVYDVTNPASLHALHPMLATAKDYLGTLPYVAVVANKCDSASALMQVTRAEHDALIDAATSMTGCASSFATDAATGAGCAAAAVQLAADLAGVPLPPAGLQRLSGGDELRMPLMRFAGEERAAPAAAGLRGLRASEAQPTPPHSLPLHQPASGSPAGGSSRPVPHPLAQASAALLLVQQARPGSGGSPTHSHSHPAAARASQPAAACSRSPSPAHAAAAAASQRHGSGSSSGGSRAASPATAGSGPAMPRVVVVGRRVNALGAPLKEAAPPAPVQGVEQLGVVVASDVGGRGAGGGGGDGGAGGAGGGRAGKTLRPRLLCCFRPSAVAHEAM